MHFLKLTLKNGEKTFVNMETVEEMRRRDNLTFIYFAYVGGGEYDCIEVTESCEEIFEKC